MDVVTEGIEGGSGMRITTRMLDEAAIRAGMPINRNSLLNYVNNGSMENTLLSALNSRKSNAASKEKKNGYEKLDTAADQLLKKTELFTAKGKDSIFEKAKESDDTKEISKNAEDLVEAYNETLQALQSSSDFLSKYYGKTLQQIASEQKDELSKIGITIEKNGTLKVDKDKIKEADLNSLEKVLGASGTFSTKVGFLAEKISDHAEANVKAVSSQYNASGDIATDFISRYNFFG